MKSVDCFAPNYGSEYDDEVNREKVIRQCLMRLREHFDNIDIVGYYHHSNTDTTELYADGFGCHGARQQALRDHWEIIDLLNWEDIDDERETDD